MSRLSLIGCLLTLNAAAAEENPFSPRHVSVTGTSVSRVQPDTVVWDVTIRRTNRDLAKAQGDCDESVKKVLALRSELKLKPEDAQTGYLSVRPKCLIGIRLGTKRPSDILRLSARSRFASGTRRGLTVSWPSSSRQRMWR